MSTVLSMPDLRRCASWWAILLLPVLPTLVIANADRGLSSGSGLVGCLVLAALGGILALGLPALGEWGGGRLRKEMEQHRAAWLVSVFVAQLPILGGPEASVGVAPIVFLVAASLVAAMTFGAEFQQRTMAGLLSQPEDRRCMWRLKMQVLGGALFLHTLVFVLSWLTVGGAFWEPVRWPLLGLLAVGGSAMAWATTTWWTLVTRTLLAGLVFSLTAPLLAFASVMALHDVLNRTNPWGRGELLAQGVLWVAGLGLLPAYVVGTLWGGHRRWLRLEAPDVPGGEGGGGLFVPAWRSIGGVRHWLARLLGKEVRLQTVALGCLVFTILVATAGHVLPAGWWSREFTTGLVIIFAAATILLAGATPIAEERRLGTLESHVLLPVSRRVQWWMKLGCALVLALGAGAVLGWRLGMATVDSQWAIGAGVLGYAFAVSLLASSGTASALRALLLGLALTTLAWALVVGFGAPALPWGSRSNMGRWEVANANPQPWFQAAEKLTEADIHGSWRLSLASSLSRPGAWLLIPALLPMLLPLALAGRNFSRPAGVPLRLLWQAGVCVVFPPVLGVLLLAVRTWSDWQTSREMMLVRAWEVLNVQKSWSPAEKRLHALRKNLPTPFAIDPQVRLRVRVPGPPPLPRREGDAEGPADSATDGNPTDAYWLHRAFMLPLDRTNRALLIEHGDIPEDLRDVFRREAIAAGESVSAPGSGRPAGAWPMEPVPARSGFHMSPELMRRYGLVPPVGTNAAIEPGR